jgi:polyisoprenoid-binding protein YceI
MLTATRTQLSTGSWQVDPVHSRVEFAAKQLGIATVRGAFRDFEGTLDLDAGRVRGSVRASSVDTSNARRDKHLRSADFLEAEEHAELRFESTEIRPLGEDAFEIVGGLTIRGVTNPIALRAELQGPETDPWGHEQIALEAMVELNRSDWGITYARGLVSDRVRLQLEIAAVKQI